MDIKIERLTKNTGNRQRLVDLIHQAIAEEVDLSYRSKTEINELIHRGEVYILQVNDQISSFLFHTPINEDIVELHSFYTFPEFRNKGYFTNLLDHILRHDQKTYLAVTFHEHIKQFLLQKGFKQINLSELPILAQFNFMLKRLRLKRILSIVRFMKTTKPIYLLKEEHNGIH